MVTEEVAPDNLPARPRRNKSHDFLKKWETLNVILLLCRMDKRLKKLRIRLPKGWMDMSKENPGGPPTFINERTEESGVLQISTAQYLSGQIPNPTMADLVALSRNAGMKSEFGTIVGEDAGSCEYGIFGAVEFSRPDFPYISVWHISDGKNFVFATFICPSPNEQDITEVKGILTSIKRKSSFWSLFGFR